MPIAGLPRSARHNAAWPGMPQPLLKTVGLIYIYRFWYVAEFT